MLRVVTGVVVRVGVVGGVAVIDVGGIERVNAEGDVAGIELGEGEIREVRSGNGGEIREIREIALEFTSISISVSWGFEEKWFSEERLSSEERSWSSKESSVTNALGGSGSDGKKGGGEGFHCCELNF